jgi:hypothetical protein
MSPRGTFHRQIVSKMVKGGDNDAPLKFTIISQRKADSGSDLPMLVMEWANLDTWRNINHKSQSSLFELQQVTCTTDS